MLDTSPAPSPAGQDGATVKRLRLGVGIIAGALPFVVLFGNMLFAQKFIWLGSISGSYYTQMRGVFVGSLCAIGVFLIAYRYARLDDIWSTVAGGLAVVVALFPTPPDRSNGVVTETQVTIGLVHFIAATSLFSVLAFFCLYVFTRSTDSTPKTPQKKIRNTIYRCTGGVIVVSIVVAAVIALAVPRSVRESWNTLFWCETAAILSFAVAWLTKGGAFRWWNDPSTPAVAPAQRSLPQESELTP
jgi:Na+/H+ antiporter NhaD/arsenite permease-like protein